MDVLYEDNHLLVVNKPAGLPTQGAAAGEDSLVVRAKEYLKQKYNKPGNVYVGVVSRLDAAVTGVVVLARTSKAAARLSEQFREAAVAKTYLAAVEGEPKQNGATLVNWLVKDESQRKVVVIGSAEGSSSPGQEARLRFSQLASLPGKRTLLQVHLETGRKHQIRVQLAHYGCPIVGDAKYGATRSFPKGIALHARRLAIAHPTQRSRLEFVAPLPESWRSLPLAEEKAVKLERESLQ
jgi:23S rRNA pseudouridine1911/1915/1917 synthase